MSNNIEQMINSIPGDWVMFGVGILLFGSVLLFWLAENKDKP